MSGSIRSLTEAQEITTDVPEDSFMYDQQEVDHPKKNRPIQMGAFLRKYVSGRLMALSEGAIATLTTSIRQIGVGTLGGAEAGHLSPAPLRRVDGRLTQRTAGQNQGRRKELLWDDRTAGGA